MREAGKKKKKCLLHENLVTCKLEVPAVIFFGNFVGSEGSCYTMNKKSVANTQRSSYNGGKSTWHLRP